MFENLPYKPGMNSKELRAYAFQELSNMTTGSVVRGDYFIRLQRVRAAIKESNAGLLARIGCWASVGFNWFVAEQESFLLEIGKGICE